MIKKYTRRFFIEKPLIGYSILGLILWITTDFFAGLIPFSIGLYITFRRQDKERATNNTKKKCTQCQMEIPSLAKKCPHCQSKLKMPVSAGGKMVAFLATVAIVSSVVIASNTSLVQQQDTYVPPAREIVIETVFDIPSLVGKSLSELETVLGTPDYNEEPPATYVQFNDDRTWDKTWNKDGYSLSVTYNIDTKKVIELFLGSDSDASLVTFRKTENIIKVGNLSTNSPEYSVEFVKLKAILGKPKSETPDGYTGAIVRVK